MARSYCFPWTAAALTVALMGTAVFADEPQAITPEQAKAERETAIAAAMKARKIGPAEIRLVDQGALALPKGDMFVPEVEAAAYLNATGNGHIGGLVGLLAPEGEGNWWAVLRWDPSGHIDDEDAKTWKADEMLANLKDGQTQSNEDRVRRGYKATEVAGWIETPNYEPNAHRLVWSVLVREIGQSEDALGSVNFHTYALGRTGYFDLNVVGSKTDAEPNKQVAHALLADIGFEKGKGYEDFNVSTDHVAEYGLAALVGGIALKKLGLIALATGFALKFAKVIALGAFAVVAGWRALFRRRKT